MNDSFGAPLPYAQASHQPTPWEPLARTLVMIAALGIVLLGLALGSSGLVIAFLGPDTEALRVVTVSISFLTLATGLGLILAWHTGQSLRGRPSGSFRPKRVGISILLFGLVVASGQAALALEAAQFLLFPFLHIAATLFPILTILAAVGRRLAGAVRWREMIVQFSSGAFLSTTLALTLEVAVIATLAVTVVAGVALQPGGLDLLATLQERLSDLMLLQDPTLPNGVALSPPLIVAAILVFAGLIPLIEEAVKTVGVGLMSYRRPGLSQAMLWGLAGGCGFALAEGLFNTTAGLDAWAAVITMRVGATLLHAFTGALMGVAWYRLRVQSRLADALGLYALSVGIHGLWNGLTVGVMALGLGALDTGDFGALLGAGLAAAAVMATLTGMTCAMVGGLWALTRYAKSHTIQGLTNGSTNRER